MKSHTELKKLAEAATPGPFEANQHGVVIGGVEREYARGTGKDQLFMACVVRDGNDGSQAANAAYIAAASPSTILALLSELDRLREDGDRWRYARDYLSIEDIEAWDDMRPHTPDEDESLRSDAAINSKIAAGKGK